MPPSGRQGRSSRGSSCRCRSCHPAISDSMVILRRTIIVIVELLRCRQGIPPRSASVGAGVAPRRGSFRNHRRRRRRRWGGSSSSSIVLHILHSLGGRSSSIIIRLVDIGRANGRRTPAGRNHPVLVMDRALPRRLDGTNSSYCCLLLCRCLLRLAGIIVMPRCSATACTRSTSTGSISAYHFRHNLCRGFVLSIGTAVRAQRSAAQRVQARTRGRLSPRAAAAAASGGTDRPVCGFEAGKKK